MAKTKSKPAPRKPVPVPVPVPVLDGVAALVDAHGFESVISALAEVASDWANDPAMPRDGKSVIAGHISFCLENLVTPAAELNDGEG